MFKQELPRIVRRFVLLSLLVLGLCVTASNYTGEKACAIGCCSPCFNCMEMCETNFPTLEEQEACKANCPCRFPCNDGC
jgi:hypothetical protein